MPVLFGIESVTIKRILLSYFFHLTHAYTLRKASQESHQVHSRSESKRSKSSLPQQESSSSEEEIPEEVICHLRKENRRPLSARTSVNCTRIMQRRVKPVEQTANPEARNRLSLLLSVKPVNPARRNDMLCL